MSEPNRGQKREKEVPGGAATTDGGGGEQATPDQARRDAELIAVHVLQSRSAPAFLIAVGLAGIALYAAYLGTWPDRAWFAAVILMIGAASWGAGAFLGFLFGVPRAPAPAAVGPDEGGPTEAPATTTGVKFRSNTNLEDVSDWLTKILVGVGLTQIGALPDALRDAATGLQWVLGGRPASGVFGVAAAAYGLICGFLLGYLWTRTFLPRAFRWSELELAESVKELGQRVGQVQHIAQKIVADAELTAAAQADLRRALAEYTAYLQQLGFRPPLEGVGIQVTSEVGDNAYYDIANNVIRIGPALASDPDVALREFTHQALYTFAPEVRDVREPGATVVAVESGLADYFAASFTDDAAIGERAAQALFGRPHIRNLANALTFAEIPADRRHVSQVVGEVWGGAFWEIRTLLGQERADRALVAAWVATDGPALNQITPADFAARVLAALAADGGPDLTDQVREIFVRRGVSLDT